MPTTPIDGAHIGFNLGPWVAYDGARIPFNLGTWWTDTPPPDPPEEVVRGLVASVGLAWRRDAPLVGAGLQLAWTPSPRAWAATGLRWKEAPVVSAALGLAWQGLPRVHVSTALAWGGASSRISHALVLAWAGLPRLAAGTGLAWWGALPHVSHAALLAFHAGPARLGQSVGLAWRNALPRVGAGRGLPWQSGAVFWRALDVRWQSGRAIRWAWIPPKPAPPIPPPPSKPDGAHLGFNLRCRWRDRHGHIAFNLGVPCYAARDTQKAYVMIDTVECVRLPDRTPIAVESFGIGGGRDAWGWTLDLTLADPDQFALLKPTAAGPRQVEVKVNGYVWTFIIEDHGRRRDFERGVDIVVTGRSRTALMAEPYAPLRAKVNAEQRTVAQLMEEELANTDVAADYDTVDWLVPAGAWSYQARSPLDAISDLAAASGGVVQSDPADMTIRIRPRYPVSPWDWPTTMPDAVIYDELVLDDSLSVRSLPLYDAVVVHGELEGAGVAVKVVREGSGGNLYAPQAGHALGNTVAACTERGRNILSDRGEQAAITKTVPIMATPVPAGGVGRVLPLQLVERREPGETWQGIATEVRIEGRVERSSAAPVWVVDQVITVERHYTDAN